MKAKLTSFLILALSLSMLVLTACSSGTAPAANTPEAPVAAPAVDPLEFSFWETDFKVEKWMTCTQADTDDTKCLALCILQRSAQAPITFSAGGLGGSGSLSPTIQLNATIECGDNTVSPSEISIGNSESDGYALRYLYIYSVPKNAALPVKGTFTFSGDNSMHPLDLSTLPAPTEDYSPEPTAAATEAPAEPDSPETLAIADALSGSWILNEVEFSTGEESNGIFDINATLGLQDGFEYGRSFILEHVGGETFNLQSDCDFAACISAMEDLPFEFDEVNFTNYSELLVLLNSSNTETGCGTLSPDDIEICYECIDGGNTLRLIISSPNIEIPEREVAGATAKGGTINLMLTFVFSRDGDS